MFLNLIEAIYKNPTADIVADGTRQCLPPKVRTKTGVSALKISMRHNGGLGRAVWKE